jgi:uncharacterized protein (TIGR04255 family)
MTLISKIPIKEAIFTIVFMPNPDYDITVPGLFLSKREDKYEKLKDIPERRIRVPNIETSEPEIMSTPVTQLIERNQEFAMQIGRDLLTVNHINNTQDLKKFRKEIFENLSLYCGITKSESIRFITLRYLFSIDLHQDLNIEEYLNFKVPMIQREDPIALGFSTTLEYKDNVDDKVLLINLRTVETKDDKINMHKLDVGVAHRVPDAMDIHNLDKWIDSAYIFIEEGLSASVTKKFIDSIAQDEIA